MAKTRNAEAFGGYNMKNFKELKVVKTRKEHECSACGNKISKGSRTLVENGFNHNEGYFSNYFHLDAQNSCYLDYLDCMQPSDRAIPEKMKNSEFFGALSFNKW